MGGKKGGVMKATVIVDNIESEDLKGEWGLCILVEYQGKTIMLDSGASELALENMEKLGFDPAEVDLAVLSHGHYDHANGFIKFFDRNRTAKLYLRSECQEDCYGKGTFGKEFIGIPKELIAEHPDRIELVTSEREIAPGIILLPHQALDHGKGEEQGMFRKVNNEMVPDDFAHEQSLIFKTQEGLVVINSCSHAGADTILDEVTEAFPQEKIHALIGGFHLFDRSPDFVHGLGKKLAEKQVDLIFTGHCSGEAAFQILKEELGDKIQQFQVGLEIAL